MEIMGFILGTTGIAFGLFAYFRVNALEKKLKETGVLDKDYQEF